MILGNSSSTTKGAASCLLSTLFLFFTFFAVHGQRAGDDLVETRSVSSSGGLLDITLTIEYADYIGAAHRFTNTRLLNGTMPGPTLRLKAGDKMRILFQNKLRDQNIREPGENEYREPDHSNLHFHGAHVTGELPSDDVRISIPPGDSFQYETDFPVNHLPGTHWMHPHVHGSSALQVGGGAALVFIVEDPPNFLPPQIEDAKEVLLMIQYMSLNTLGDIIDDINDDVMKINRPGTDNSVSQADYRMVNGQFQPTLDMRPGEWQRWRIVYGSWLRNPLNLDITSGNCEMQLLAKDGIYISDYPREITMAPIPTGGRADIMVRCSSAGDYTAVDFDDEVILNLRVRGNRVNSQELEEWGPAVVPPYLISLRRAFVADECDCRLRMHGGNSCPGRFCVNEESFDPERYVHTVKFGEVIQRSLENVGAHPYHQHVYPFQIHDNVNNDRSITSQQKQYFKEGDWHDVIMIDDLDDDLIVRYRPDVYDGRIMLHCHRLNHEDRGMMSQEHIVVNGRCDCDAQSISLPVNPNQEASRDPPPPSSNNAANAAAATGGFGCVSGSMTVDVKGKGSAVAIKDVEIGDYIRTETLKYSRVYSFGHYNQDQIVSYLRIQLSEGDYPSILEITGDHMVFLSNKIAVPASDVRVGDTLLGEEEEERVVVSIGTITRRGAYGPFTYAGTALINGVSVSNYITMKNDASSSIITLLPHWMAHAFLSPRRWYCQTSFFWNQCENETRTTNEDGIPDWMYLPYRIFLSSIVKDDDDNYSSSFAIMMTVLKTCMVLFASMWYILDHAVLFTTSSSGILSILLIPMTIFMMTRNHKQKKSLS